MEVILSNGSADDFEQRVALSRLSPFPNDQQPIAYTTVQARLKKNAELIPPKPSVDPKQQRNLFQACDRIGHGTETEIEKYHVIVVTAESGFLQEPEKR